MSTPLTEHLEWFLEPDEHTNKNISTSSTILCLLNNAEGLIEIISQKQGADLTGYNLKKSSIKKLYS